jgi:hypothetical protein
MTIAVALEAFIALGLFLSVVFSVWAIRRDVHKIREHFDRVDRLAAQKLGYTAKPAVTRNEAAALADPFGTASGPLGLGSTP